jgi:hypothetical protein
MFWPNSDADEAGTEPARQSCGFQQPHGPRSSSICCKVAENYTLHPLCVLRCKLPAALYFRQVTGAKSAFAERSCQNVGGSDGVLDCKVDPDAPNRRHGVRRIADANEYRDDTSGEGDPLLL